MRAAKIAAVIVLILGTPFVPGEQTAPSKGERWAVVIGAGHPRRPYATADAEAVYQPSSIHLTLATASSPTTSSRGSRAMPVSTGTGV